MTDTELVRACAERVMNWTAEMEFPWEWNDQDGVMIREDWNPLTSEADCWAMVDKLSAVGWNFEATGYSGQGWIVRLWRHEPKYTEVRTFDPDRRRAIVLACLRAVGVDPAVPTPPASEASA